MGVPDVGGSSYKSPYDELPVVEYFCESSEAHRVRSCLSSLIMAVGVAGAKLALRRSLGQTLRSLGTDSIQKQSSAVSKHVVAARVFSEARAVAVFLSMPSGELSTNAILKAVFQSNKTCFVPRVEGKRDMNLYECFGESDIATYERSKWHIPEPPADDSKRRNALTSDELDLVIVPGMAFDFRNRRIGHGRGYYDTYFSRLRQQRASRGLNMPFLLGVALSPQMVTEVPMEATDWILDQVVHPEGFTEETRAGPATSVS